VDGMTRWKCVEIKTTKHERVIKPNSNKLFYIVRRVAKRDDGHIRCNEARGGL